MAGATLHITPGAVEWIVASPKEDFLRGEIDALLQSKGALNLNGQTLIVTGIEAIPAPDFTKPLRCTCLTPIIAGVPSPDGRATPLYLRPTDGAAFGSAVRTNLLGKHCALYGSNPTDERLQLQFDADYLMRNSHAGTKKATINQIDIVGALAPFTLSGSAELMQTAWQTGLGQRSAAGFGMWDVVR